MMYPAHISRSILKAAANNPPVFKIWMRQYIRPKDFYLISRSGIASEPISAFISRTLDVYLAFGTHAKVSDIVSVIQRTNRLEIARLVVKTLFSRNADHRGNSYHVLSILLFLTRLDIDGTISGSVPRDLYFYCLRSSNLKTIKFYFPVCPDYSYETKDSHRYIYTFKELGCGIGLVAQRAVNSVNEISEIARLSGLGKEYLNLTICLGDFESSDANCNRLGETRKSFIEKCKQSTLAIKNEIQDKGSSILVSDLCAGLDNWECIMRYVSLKTKITSFDALFRSFPTIRHDKNLTSRIPLYRKWHGDACPLKEVFTDQVLEYATMGFLMGRSAGEIAFIFASDHKAMRTYYSLCSEAAVLGSAASY